MGSPELGLVFSCYGREGIKARRGVPPGSDILTKLGMTHTCTFVGQRSMFGVTGGHRIAMDTLLKARRLRPVRAVCLLIPCLVSSHLSIPSHCGSEDNTIELCPGSLTLAAQA